VGKGGPLSSRGAGSIQGLAGRWIKTSVPGWLLAGAAVDSLLCRSHGVWFFRAWSVSSYAICRKFRDNRSWAFISQKQTSIEGKSLPVRQIDVTVLWNLIIKVTSPYFYSVHQKQVIRSSSLSGEEISQEHEAAASRPDSCQRKWSLSES
jgi:hypothetical protein